MDASIRVGWLGSLKVLVVGSTSRWKCSVRTSRQVCRCWVQAHKHVHCCGAGNKRPSRQAGAQRRGVANVTCQASGGCQRAGVLSAARWRVLTCSSSQGKTCLTCVSGVAGQRCWVQAPGQCVVCNAGVRARSIGVRCRWCKHGSGPEVTGLLSWRAVQVSKHGGRQHVGHAVQGWMPTSEQEGCRCSLERVGASHWVCISAVLSGDSMSSEKGKSTC